MKTKTIIELPDFDTGQFSSAELLLKEGHATLTLHIDELEDISLHFIGVRWHNFTSLYNCSTNQLSAYFKVVEITHSDYLRQYKIKDKLAAESHHYRIFLDDHGCHEIIAKEVTLG